jgi:hypothetical protein
MNTGEGKSNGHSVIHRENSDESEDEQEQQITDQADNANRQEQNYSIGNGNSKKSNEQTLNEQTERAADVASVETEQQNDASRRMNTSLSMITEGTLAFSIVARPMAERTPNPVLEIVPEEILQVKIADLGNACWTVHSDY